jgi:membrane peptidoglycan carboxypeptidase
MIDLAAFYATVANEGVRPQPHAIDSIELNDRAIYAFPDQPPASQIAAIDRASFYQLKTILQGVVARGTARAISSLSPYVAGKTGTTEDAVDGWFVGFTNPPRGGQQHAVFHALRDIYRPLRRWRHSENHDHKLSINC